MFENVSDEIKIKTLLKVVRNLMKNSRNAEIFKLQEFMKESRFPISQTFPSSQVVQVSKEEVKEKIKEKIKEEVKVRYEKPNDKKIVKEKSKDEIFPKKSFMHPKKFARSERPIQFKTKRVLRVPNISLPRHLSSIRPVASEKNSIDLGKLSPFVQDPHVLTIETDGENEVVYVTGSFGRKPTGIRLSRTEIEEVIDRFSIAAKIPKDEGLFKVAVGKLLLVATISESVSSRFIIEKIKNNY